MSEMELTREQRIEKKKRELARLKDEYQKANTPYKRAIIQDEMRSVARELGNLCDGGTFKRSKRHGM